MVMKIILTEHQIRTYLNENISETDITITKEQLENLLISLKNDGYQPLPNNSNILKYMGGLPKGDYFITDATGTTIRDVEHNLLTTLDSTKSLTQYDNIQQFLLFKQNNNGTFSGKGIMLTQPNVVPSRKGDMESTPRGAHGGK